MKTQRKSKFLALLLSLAVVFSSLPLATIGASAEELPAEAASVSDDAISETTAENETPLEANDAQGSMLLGANNTEEVSADANGTPETRSANLNIGNVIAGINNPTKNYDGTVKANVVQTSSDMIHVALGYALNAASTTTPITYRVLSNGDNKLLLDCDKVLAINKQYYSNAKLSSALNWSYSTYTSDIYTNMLKQPTTDGKVTKYSSLSSYQISSDVWNKAILSTTQGDEGDKKTYANGLKKIKKTVTETYDNSLNNEKLFCLTYYNIETYYGYIAGTTSTSKFPYLGKTGINGEKTNWWLRDSFRYYYDNYSSTKYLGAGYVGQTKVEANTVDAKSGVGVSPALYLDMAKVKFTLATSAAKSNGTTSDDTTSNVDISNIFQATTSGNYGTESDPWILGIQTNDTNLTKVNTGGTAYSITIPKDVKDGTKLQVFAYDEDDISVSKTGDRTLHTTPLTEINGANLNAGANVSFNLSNVPVIDEYQWKVAAVLTNSDGTVVAFGDAKQAQTITASDTTISLASEGEKISATCSDISAKLTYKSANTDVLDVDANTGKLSPKKVGKATVTITAPVSDYYAETTKDVTVTVKDPTISVSTPTSYPTYNKATGTDMKVTTEGVPAGKKLQLEWIVTPTNVDVDPITVSTNTVLRINTSNETKTGEYSFRLKYTTAGDTTAYYSNSSFVFKVNKATATDTMKKDSENILNKANEKATVQLPLLSDGNIPKYLTPETIPGYATFTDCFGFSYSNNDLTLTLKQELVSGTHFPTGTNIYKFNVPVKGEKNYEDYYIEVTINLTSQPTIQLNVADKIEVYYSEPKYTTSYAVVVSPTDVAITLRYSVPAEYSDIISVDQLYGYITFKKAGTAVIQVEAKDYANKYKTDTEYVQVIVNKKPVARPTGASFTYDGTQKTGVSSGEGYRLSGTISETNAGTYTAKATLLDNYCWDDGSTDREEDITWSIDKKDLIPVSAAIAPKTYDRTNTATVTSIGFMGLVQRDYLKPADYTASGIFSNVEAGNNIDVDVTVELNNTTAANNYSLTTPTFKQASSISQKEIGVTWTNLTITYDGQEHSPIAVPVGCIDGDACSVAVNGKAIDVGKNYIAYTAGLLGDDAKNYKLTTNGITTYEIVPADLCDCAVVMDIPSYTYTGDAIAPTVTVVNLNTTDYATLTEGKDYTVTYTSNTNVGTAKVTINGTGNYTGSIETTFNITKATVEGDYYTKDTESIKNSKGETATVQLPVLPDGNIPNYSTPVAASGMSAFDKCFEASYNENDLHLTLKEELTGDVYKFNVPVKDEQNYNNYNIEVTINLTELPTIVLDVADKIEVDYSDPVYTASYAKVTYPTDVDTISLTYSVPDEYKNIISVDSATGYITFKSAGTAKIKVEAKDSANKYKADTEYVQVTVNKKQVAQPTGENLTYNGSVQAGVKPGEGYNLSGDISATDVGTYTAEATLMDNYCWDDGSTDSVKYITWSIDKKEITPIYANIDQKIYDGTNTATVTYILFSGLEQGDTLENGTDYTASGVFSDVAAGNNVNATVTVELKDTAITKNYKLSKASFEQASSILQKEVGVSWTNLVFTYDGQEFTPAAIATGLVDGDVCDIIVQGHAINAGKYVAIAAGLKGDKAKNYRLNQDTTTFTILPADLDICTITDIPSCTYTGDAITPTVTVTNFRITAEPILKEGKDYTITYASNTNVGRATAEISGIGNYTGSLKTAFDITKAKVDGDYYTKDTESIKNIASATSIVQLPVLPDGNIPTYSTPETIEGHTTFTDCFEWSYDETTKTDLKLTLNKKLASETDLPAGANNIYKFKVPVSNENYDDYYIEVSMKLTANFPIELDVADKIEITYLTTGTNCKDYVHVNVPSNTSLVTTTYKVATGSDVIDVTTDGNITTKAAGNAVIEVKATATDYADDTEQIPVIVNKKQIARPTTVTDLTYDGTLKTGVKSGEGYDLTGHTGTDAGTYHATATPKANYEWKDGSEDAEAITWSIAKCEITPKVTVEEKEYDGTNVATVTDVTFEGLVTGTTLTSGTDYTVSAVFADVKASEQATANVTIALNETGTTKNYKLSRNEFVEYSKINKKEIGVTWTNLDFIYDGDNHAPTAIATGCIGGDECDITVTGAAKDADNHTATAQNVTGTDCDNYKLPDSKPTKEFTISPMTINVSWTVTNFTYNGKDQKPLATSPDFISVDNCEIEVSGEQTNVGTYTATATNITGTGCNNYKLPVTSPTTLFTISRATAAINDLVTYTAPDNPTYDKTAKTATVTPTDGITGTGALTVKYYNDANNEVTPTDVGTYVVKASMATGTNYEAISESKVGAFEITPKPIKVSTWTDTEFTYDGAAHKPIASSTDFINGDICGIFVSGKRTDVGTYVATATSVIGLRGNNYTLSDTDAKHQTSFTIKKASSADLPISATTVAVDIVNTVGSTAEVKIDLPTGGCTFGTPSTNSSIELSTPANDGLATAKVTKTLTVGEKYKITIPVTAINYEDYDVTVTLTAVSKAAESEKDLQDAISKGGNIEIKNDITLEGQLDVSKDSTISGNGKTITVSEGIKVEEGVTLTVNNSNIVSKDGKTALTLNSGAEAVLEKVKISKSKSDNGAVKVSAGSTLTVKAGTNITDNTASNGQLSCNIYLGEGGTIDISNLKASDASTTKIGITSSVAPTADKPVVIGGASTEDVSKCFVSDDDRYEIIDYIPDTQANADEVLHYVALALKDTPEPTPTKNGWVQTDGKWQYYKDDKFLTDWHNDIPGWEGQWFYFDNTTGYSKSAWANDIHGWEGQWFYFNPNTCVMMKNWVYDGGTRFFYLDDNTGVMKKGWNFLNWSGGANWFCFSNDGICYTNTVTPDGYRVDQNGVWVQ